MRLTRVTEPAGGKYCTPEVAGRGLFLLCFSGMAFALSSLAGCSPGGEGRRSRFLPLEQRHTVILQDFRMEPAVLRLREGKKARFRFLSEDHPYLLEVAGTNLVWRVPARGEATFSFSPPPAGIYEIACRGPAGPRCQRMNGQLEVLPQGP